MKNSEVYAKVLGSVMETMATGFMPWSKPWTANGAVRNAVTGRRYHGGNVFALMLETLVKGYSSAGWVTFKQALSAGCVVRKGERATPVYYMTTLNKKLSPADIASGETVGKKVFFARLYSVFNLDQLADLDGAEGSLATLRERVTGKTHQWEPITECERVVSNTGAVIKHGGDRACYIPSLDEIHMPNRDTFHTGAEGYYGTIFHELTHWTGHEKRLNRLGHATFGSPTYAAEELVAELGAAFLSHRAGVPMVSQSSAYLQSWLNGFTDHPGMLASAASAAQKASDYIWPDGEESTEQSQEEN